MAELFELEEELIRLTSDIKDKYEADLAQTVTGKHTLPVGASQRGIYLGSNLS